MKKKIFELKTRNKDITEEQLIDEIKRVFKKLKKEKLTKEDFDLNSKFGSHLIVRKIGWNNAKIKAGIEKIREVNISDKKLMDNIFTVWKTLDRQPKRDEMLPPISKYSVSPYRQRYGSWEKALQTFMSIISKNKIQYTKLAATAKPEPLKHKTKRTISKQLALTVFKRDGWVCKICGRSNKSHPKLKFEIDHIKPYAEGGETILKNLQVLCKEHNRTKGKMKLS